MNSRPARAPASRPSAPLLSCSVRLPPPSRSPGPSTRPRRFSGGPDLTPEPQPATQIQPAGCVSQRGLTHESRLELGQLALGGVRKRLGEIFADNERQHRVAQELQSLVVLAGLVLGFIGIGGVSERFVEEARLAKQGSDAL